MKLLTKHWYDMGAVLALLVLAYLFINGSHLSSYKIIQWVSLITLFLHQLEEYRIAGTFPGMVNTVMYHSNLPDRFPLNAKTALFVNVIVGWISYFAAAIFAENAVWLGIATILVSIGNTIGHTFLFNIKAKSFYNAGLATCWLLFVPVSFFFFKTIYQESIATATDYLIGVPLGILFNYLGILKLIDWMADENTAYVFPQRNLLPKNRKETRLK